MAGSVSRPSTVIGALLAGGDRAVGVGGPLRPGARVERGRDAGDGQRGDLVGGGDAGAAVDADRSPAGRDAEPGEPVPQLGRGQERAVWREVLGGGGGAG